MLLRPVSHFLCHAVHVRRPNSKNHSLPSDIALGCNPTLKLSFEAVSASTLLYDDIVELELFSRSPGFWVVTTGRSRWAWCGFRTFARYFRLGLGLGIGFGLGLVGSDIGSNRRGWRRCEGIRLNFLPPDLDDWDSRHDVMSLGLTFEVER